MSACDHYSEAELLDALCEGNAAAFDEIYQRHWDGMFRSAYALLKDRDAAMDILQEVFIWLWQHRDHIQIVSSLKTYLSSSVYYKAANYIRQGKIRQTFFEELKTIYIEQTEEDQMEIKELKSIIKQHTSQLPEKCRQVYYLSRNEHLSNKEIAEKMGISVKTVENQMTIALRRLRASLKKIVLWLVCFL
ncbi:MAG: RNA polymerase sigma-70 factor [Chitinophagaceae bacterium]|nr:RNA polymerase sigma-70 factor [Chitinophagaceae bacterium]